MGTDTGRCHEVYPIADVASVGYVDVSNHMIVKDSLWKESIASMTAAFDKHLNSGDGGMVSLDQMTMYGQDVLMGNMIPGPLASDSVLALPGRDGVLTGGYLQPGLAMDLVDIRAQALRPKIICIEVAGAILNEKFKKDIRSGSLFIDDGGKFSTFDWSSEISVLFCGKTLAVRFQGRPVSAGGVLILQFQTVEGKPCPMASTVYGDILLEGVDQRAPFKATIKFTESDVLPEELPNFKPFNPMPPGLHASTLRNVADWNYALAVGDDNGLADKGWVCMRYRPGSVSTTDLHCRWIFSAVDGSIRSAANPTCCLCAAKHGLKDKGQVWIWTKKIDEEVGVHGMWTYGKDKDNTLRVQADPECLLAVAKHGLTDGGQVWMWKKPTAESVDKWCQWLFSSS